jgi:hypothetical protein
MDAVGCARAHAIGAGVLGNVNVRKKFPGGDAFTSVGPGLKDAGAAFFANRETDSGVRR